MENKRIARTPKKEMQSSTPGSRMPDGSVTRLLYISAASVFLFFSYFFSPVFAGGENEIDQFFFDRAVKTYEASNSKEIEAVSGAVMKISDAALAYDKKPELFLQMLSVSFDILSKNPEKLKTIKYAADSLALVFTAGVPFSVQIYRSRAAVYFHAAPFASKGPPYGNFFESAPMPLYFIKDGGAWRADGGFMLEFALKSDGTPHLRDENALEIDQNWMLSQDEEFEKVLAFFPSKYLVSSSAEPLKKLGEYIVKNPKSAAAHFYMAVALTKQFKYGYDHIRASRELAPDNIFIEITYSRILMIRKFGRFLNDRLFEMYRACPHNPLALMVLGEMLNLRYRYDLSKLAFDRAALLYKFMTPHYHMVFADTFEKLQNYKAAAFEFVKCASYGPLFYYSRHLAARMYIKAGDEDSAAGEYEAVIDHLKYAELKNEAAGFLMNYHSARGNRDEYYNYRRYYLTSLINSPSFVFALLVLWLFYFMRRTVVKYSLFVILPVACRFSRSRLVHEKALDIYHFYGRYDAGIESFKKYLAAVKACGDQKEYCRGLMKLAGAYSRLYKVNEALPLYREALELSPGDTEAVLGLGICEYDMKNYAIALEYFSSGMDSDPENHLFYYYCGLCRMMMGRRAEGIDNIMSAYKVNNAFEPAVAICESYFLGENKVAELVHFYDDMLVFGDLKENFIERSLRLHITRMDAPRLRTFLKAYEKMDIRGRDTFNTIGCAYREIGMAAEAEKAMKMGLEAAVGVDFGAKGPLGLFANFIKRHFWPERYRVAPLQYLELGITYKCLGREDLAAKCFKKAAGIDSNYPFVYYFLKDYNRSFELMARQISESELPWTNASIVEAVYLSLKEIKDEAHLLRYREWGRYYAGSFPDEFGIFSYKYLKYIPKAKYLEIFNERTDNRE